LLKPINNRLRLAELPTCKRQPEKLFSAELFVGGFVFEGGDGAKSEGKEE
jgi:hypothetical protein